MRENQVTAIIIEVQVKTAKINENWVKLLFDIVCKKCYSELVGIVIPTNLLSRERGNNKMYSENEESVEILDTFAARELQQNGHSSAPDDVMDYMQRTDCNFDTLRKMNRRKNHPTLFIV